MAHVGYYREELVRRRQWLDEAAFAEIVAFCQTIPGPGSSQTGFAIGLVTGGWSGALAAWAAFTAPSAALMLAFAMGQGAAGGAAAQRMLHGLQLVAVAVVAQAVMGMQRVLAPDRARVGIAVGAAGLALLLQGPASQLAAILLGAVAGLVLFRWQGTSAGSSFRETAPKRAGLAALAVFGGLFFVPMQFFADFYRTGALVFGGGHVVLPLLQSVTVSRGLMDEKTFLAGYGMAQAIPGPLFCFAAYLGAVSARPPNGLTGGLLALLALFLPGLLLVAGLLPFWAALRERPALRGALAGVNASVVGLLAAALYRPVWTGSVHTLRDFALAAAAFLALSAGKAAPWAVVVAVAVLSYLIL